MRKGSYADFHSWTGTSGYGPELLDMDQNFSQTRAHLSQPNRNFLSGWHRKYHRKFHRNFRSCIFSTNSNLVRMLTFSSEFDDLGHFGKLTQRAIQSIWLLNPSQNVSKQYFNLKAILISGEHRKASFSSPS